MQTERPGPYFGLLLDWGGVMTANLFASFDAFCEAEGLDREAVAHAFRRDPQARALLIALEEGRVAEQEFERRLGERLGMTAAAGLIERLLSGATPEPTMVEAVRAARRAGVHTGLISNSWGTTRYPRDLLDQLFDAVVISGEVGVRKPAPKIYQLGAQAIGVEPAGCVFVDDLSFNLEPARELGMAVIHHIEAPLTIAALERLFGLPLSATTAASGL